jgi:hypothetical protein
MRLVTVAFTGLLLTVVKAARRPSAPPKADTPRMWGYPYGWGISDEDEPEYKDDIQETKPVTRGTCQVPSADPTDPCTRYAPTAWQEDSTTLPLTHHCDCSNSGLPMDGSHQSPKRRNRRNESVGSLERTQRRIPTFMSRTSQIFWTGAWNRRGATTTSTSTCDDNDDRHDWVYLYDPL